MIEVLWHVYVMHSHLQRKVMSVLPCSRVRDDLPFPCPSAPWKTRQVLGRHPSTMSRTPDKFRESRTHGIVGYLIFKYPRLTLLHKSSLKRVRGTFYDLFLVQEMNLPLGRVDVHVYCARVDL